MMMNDCGINRVFLGTKLQVLIIVFVLPKLGRSNDSPEWSEETIKGDLIAAVINFITSMVRQKSNAETLAYAGGAIILTAIVYGLVDPTLVTSEVSIGQYNFQVACPISSKNNIHDLANLLMKMGVSASKLREDWLISDCQGEDVHEYIIYVQMRKVTNESKYGQFVYCTFVREWEEEDCSNARPVCISPGPIFHIARDQKIDVAWVYDIRPEEGVTLNNTLQFDNCYFPPPLSGHNCHMNNKAPGERLCTYFQPTNLSYPTAKSSSISVNLSMIPISTHIHGLQVRPTFDGNPLSYLTKNGNIGLGFQSLLDDGYFKLFNNYSPTVFTLNTNMSLYAKINRYDNFQPPGSLLYHDHSMHATYPNILNGMMGAYLIHDRKVEKNLPSKKYEVVIMITTPYADHSPSAFTDQSPIHHTQPHSIQSNSPTSQDKIKSHMIKVNPEQATVTTRSKLSFERNQTYRIRLMNGYFQAIFEDIMFLTNCNLTDGADNFKDCTQLNFSVIGSDSTLFDRPVHNINNLTLSSAQRYQILIVFDGVRGDQRINPISADEKYVYLVTKGNTLLNTILRKRFTLQPATPNKNLFPTDITQLNVPFYDLRTISEPCKAGYQVSTKTTSTCISAVRFRPLTRDAVYNLVINGHLRFSGSGAADRPRIGTTQDWYFINTYLSLDLPHNIHFHLVNFQIISYGELKKIPKDPASPNQCSYYEVDYYLSIGVIVKNATYQQLCDQIRTLMYADPAFSAKMSSAYREDVPTSGNTYGFNLLTEMSQQEIEEQAYQYSSCPQSHFKYICNTSIEVPQEDRRWKDTALINPNFFVHLRIRWTKTDYDPKVKSYPFFNVPEDQLIQFPGYLYHCHFAVHEDNQMMRPFTLQPSFFFDTYYSPKRGSKLDTCMRRKGVRNSEGWASRYECINEILGC